MTPHPDNVNPDDTPASPTPNRRLALMLMVLTLYSLVSVVRMLTLPPALAVFADEVRIFDVISGVMWSAVFIIMTVRVLQPAVRRPAVRRPALMLSVFGRFPRSFATSQQVAVLLTIFGLYQLVRVALFAQADYDRQRLPFLIALWLILLAGLAMWGVLCRLTFKYGKRGRPHRVAPTT